MKNILNLLLSSFFLCFSPIDSASAQDLLPRPDKPLTLDQCVALGLRVNPALRGRHMPNETAWDAFFGATLTVPIFGGFLSPSQVSEQRANLRNLLAQEETLKLNIRLESEQAYLSAKQAEEQVRVTQKTVSQAQENYELAAGRYQVGVGSPLEITDAEVSLANAKANNIQALYNYKVSEARIEKAMGINR